jgi:ubiquinone/menaquinone biosynthesis C-methylase UbiE
MKSNDPEVIAAQLRTPHGSLATETGRFMAKGNAGLYKELMKFYQPAERQTVLEVGPGNGAFIPQLISPASDISYTSVDLSEEMVRDATELNKELTEQGKAEILQGDCRKLRFENEGFDHALSLNTIYFMDPLEVYLEELKRVMRKGAMLYLGYRSKQSMLQLPFTRFGFVLYEPMQVEILLEQAGFKQVKSHVFEDELVLPEGRKLRLESVLTLASK